MAFGTFAGGSGENRSKETLVIPLGSAPWNRHSACPIDINGRIEIESFNLLKPGKAIPLGSYIFSKAPSTHKEGGALLLLTLGPEPLYLNKAANKDSFNELFILNI